MFGIGLLLIVGGALCIIYAMQGSPIYNKTSFLTPGEPGVKPPPGGEPRPPRTGG